MNAAPTFERAYAAIRTRILSGDWRPGQRLDLASLADQLDASLTPVRDALNRLVGERLLATGTGDGFGMPTMTEADLRDLYGWNLEILLAAVRARTIAEPFIPRPSEAESPAERVRRMFASIAARARNREYAREIASVSDRLQQVRSIESKVVLDTEVELQQLDELIRLWQPVSLRSALTRYHRRRSHKSGDLIYALHRS